MKFSFGIPLIFLLTASNVFAVPTVGYHPPDSKLLGFGLQDGNQPHHTRSEGGTHAKRIARLHPRQSWLKVPNFLQKKPKSKVTTQHSKSRPEGTTGEKTTKKNVDTTSNDMAPVPQNQPLTGMDKFRIVVDVIGIAGTIMYPVSMFMPPLGGGKNGGGGGGNDEDDDKGGNGGSNEGDEGSSNEGVADAGGCEEPKCEFKKGGKGDPELDKVKEQFIAITKYPGLTPLAKKRYMDTICQNPKVSVKQYEEFGAIIENATEPQDVKGAYHITEQTDWPRQAQLAGPENVLAFMAYLKCADGIDEEEMQQIEALKQYANKR